MVLGEEMRNWLNQIVTQIYKYVRCTSIYLLSTREARNRFFLIKHKAWILKLTRSRLTVYMHFKTRGWNMSNDAMWKHLNEKRRKRI